MPNVFFTSDLHFGHVKVSELRGFASPAGHDAELADRWIDTVRPRDQVWILGDLAASSPAYALELLSRLPGEKHLILGNHDRAHPMHRNAHRCLPAYLEVFTSVAQSARRKIAGEDVLLSHFPYTRDRHEPRHLQWRLPNLGLWLLHGHTHGTERETIVEAASFRSWDGDVVRQIMPSREIHVGVDAWDFTPVALETLGEIIEARS